MGYAKDQVQKDREKPKKRGSTRNPDRLAAFARASNSTGADWGGCDAIGVQAVVVAITELGGAVTFGLSRDKGAHSLTLLLDGSRQTLWFNGDANLGEELEGVKQTLDAMT